MSSPTGSNASAGIVLVAVSWTFFVVSLFVVCLRFYADFFVIHLVRTDSYLSFLTFVSDVLESWTVALTLCRAAICAVLKTTKVSTLGR